VSLHPNVTSWIRPWPKQHTMRAFARQKFLITLYFASVYFPELSKKRGGSQNAAVSYCVFLIEKQHCSGNVWRTVGAT